MGGRRKQLISPAMVVAVVVGLILGEGEGEGQAVQVINVEGVLCCTSSGNCVGGAPGVGGAPVMLNCTSAIGSMVTLAQGVTGSTGGISLSATNLLGAVGSVVRGRLVLPLPCQVSITLPLNQTLCPILNNATGLLVSTPTLLNQTLSLVYGGLVVNLRLSTFLNTTTLA